MIKLVVSHGDGVVCIKHKSPPEMCKTLFGAVFGDVAS